jgi:hypothetical protein
MVAITIVKINNHPEYGETVDAYGTYSPADDIITMSAQLQFVDPQGAAQQLDLYVAQDIAGLGTWACSFNPPLQGNAGQDKLHTFVIDADETSDGSSDQKTFKVHVKQKLHH